MRIIFLTQYYPPETGAAQNRLSDLSKRLTNAGHRVTVLTALPSYPKGKIYPGYRGRLTMIEEEAGIRIVRIWAYTTKKKSFVPRILNYLSFSLLSIVFGWWTLENADVVFAESPPLFVGFSGYLLSKLKDAKFVLNISDLWPESAVVLGVLRNQRLIRCVTWAEEWLYCRASLVTGQTQGIVDSIRTRCPETRIHLMTNGVSPEFIVATAQALASRERVRREFGVAGKFVIGYAGLHGLVYGLEVVLKAANVLAKFDKIQFLLIGDGPEKHRLQEKAKLDGLVNVSFFSTLPAARMPEIFTAMDVMLITLRRHDLFKGTLPSKLFESMGAGVPVVAAMQGEAQRVVENAHCGICVEPEDAPAMAEAILTLFRDPALQRRMGENGREYASNHYNRKEIPEQFEDLLVNRLVATRSKSGEVEKEVSSEGPQRETMNLRHVAESKAED